MLRALYVPFGIVVNIRENFIICEVFPEVIIIKNTIYIHKPVYTVLGIYVGRVIDFSSKNIINIQVENLKSLSNIDNFIYMKLY